MVRRIAPDVKHSTSYPGHPSENKTMTDCLPHHEATERTE
jgi:hypothetical protein